VTLYALDTTTFSQLMREHPKVMARLASLSADDRVVICTIVRGEIIYGLRRLQDGKKKRSLEEKAAKLFDSIPCEAVPPGAADRYARIKREAEQKGTPLDENDLWIAAAALDSGATLAAADGDFRRIEGLSSEDWSG
jgi:predicted nucleic acid-binding protein